MSGVSGFFIGSRPEDQVREALESNIRIEKELRQLKWDLRFLNLARVYASYSKDPSTKTGAIIADQKFRPVGWGYNGFAHGVDDSPERYANRDLKYKMVVHCERNAMQFAQRDLTGCTLYTWPFMSCAPCAAHVINSGISRVVAPINDNPRWQEDFRLSQQQFSEAGVQVCLLQIPEWMKNPYTEADAPSIPS